MKFLINFDRIGSGIYMFSIKLQHLIENNFPLNKYLILYLILNHVSFIMKAQAFHLLCLDRYIVVRRIQMNFQTR